MAADRLNLLSGFLCSTPAPLSKGAEPKQEGPIRTRPQMTLGDIVSGLVAGRSAWIPVLVFSIGVYGLGTMILNGFHRVIEMST